MLPLLDVQLAKNKLKYEVINSYIGFKINRTQAAQKLNCHPNHIPRLVKKFKKDDPNSYTHLSYGKNKKSKTTNIDYEELITIYSTLNSKVIDNKQLPLSFALFYDDYIGKSAIDNKRISLNNIEISYSNLVSNFKKLNLISPYSRVTKNENGDIELPSNKENPSGDIVELDGSFGHCLPGEDDENLCVVLAVDANGYFLSLKIDHAEYSNSYVSVITDVVEQFGVPKLFITDNRTGISENLVDTNRTSIIGNGIRKLGSQLFTTSDYKGKIHVEHAHGDVRRRIMQMAILDDVQTIDEFNAAAPQILDRLNSHYKKVYVENNWGDKVKIKDHKKYFFKEDSRSVNANYTLQVYNQLYLPISRDGSIMRIKAKTKVITFLDVNNVPFEIEHKKTRYKLIPATKEMVKKLDNNVTKTYAKKMFKDSIHFTFRNKKYHILDPNHFIVQPEKFDENKTININYNSKTGVIKNVKIESHVFLVKLGELKEINYSPKVELIDYKMKYNGRISIKKTEYVLLQENGNQFMPGDGESITIEFHDGNVANALYKEVHYKIRPSAITNFEYPKSKLSAKKFFSSKIFTG